RVCLESCIFRLKSCTAVKKNCKPSVVHSPPPQPSQSFPSLSHKTQHLLFKGLKIEHQNIFVQNWYRFVNLKLALFEQDGCYIHSNHYVIYLLLDFPCKSIICLLHSPSRFILFVDARMSASEHILFYLIVTIEFVMTCIYY
ncbi:hypothetical protein Leryth_016642, partial [Lithospermum erythrorhizon]